MCGDSGQGNYVGMSLGGIFSAENIENMVTPAEIGADLANFERA